MILVEGKYDKIKLESIVDGLILTTDGFRIFKDRNKRELIRRLAAERGLIVLTDSDVAGFRIRSLIRSVVGDAPVTHLYIPQIAGKEKRKTAPSREGTLGVEGMEAALLRRLLAGAAGPAAPRKGRPITRMDLVEDGLSGGKNSAKKRRALMQELSLPPYLSSKALLAVLNRLMVHEEYRELVSRLPEE